VLEREFGRLGLLWEMRSGREGVKREGEERIEGGMKQGRGEKRGEKGEGKRVRKSGCAWAC